MTRQEILSYAKEKNDELIKLVSLLIQIPNENPGGNQQVAVDFVKGYLNKYGINTEQVQINPDFPCVLAEIGDRKAGYNVILNGHIDVVPAGDRSQWDWDPFGGEVTDKLILGRGTSDMKAGLASGLFAMRILQETKADLKGSIRLHMVSDEESGGEFGTHWLCENGYADNADSCIVCEPTSKSTIEIGQKGGLHLIIKAQGKSAHGSLGGFKGDNAILKLQNVLSHLSELTKVEGHYPDSLLHSLKCSQFVAEKELGVKGIGHIINHVTQNVGLISGGSRPNMVPDSAETVVDCRLPIGVDHDEVERVVNSIIENSGEKGVICEFHWKNDANYTVEEAPIVQALKKNAEKVWNIEVIPAWQWASSDAREYRMLGIQTIQYGPSNIEGIHAKNENVDIEDVLNSSQIYLMTLCDLLGIK
ncbi:MAG: ArgE/DapE family deacylase [Peptostreptococcaceae bacterium]|nr:ArgE/DapE family deacylase [Peptostreptococcaceae bacterium]